MSQIDLNGVSNGNRVENGNLAGELLQGRHSTDFSASQSAARFAPGLLNRQRENTRHQLCYGPATSVANGYALPSVKRIGADRSVLAASIRQRAAGSGLGAIGRSIAAVLTDVMKIPGALFPCKVRAHLSRLRGEQRAMAPGARSEADLLDSIYNVNA